MTAVRSHVTLVEKHKGQQVWHCVLSWDSQDPWNVGLLFPGPPPVVWSFARGVWADGLVARSWGAGGDVLVEPLAGGDLHVWLRGMSEDDPDRCIELDLLTSQRVVARFLRDTIRFVRLGEEPLPVSADDLLAGLFRG